MPLVDMSRVVAVIAAASASVAVAEKAAVELNEGHLSLLQTRALYTSHSDDQPLQTQPPSLANTAISHAEVLEFLSSFRPCAKCKQEVRLGAATDGGYHMCGELLPAVTAAYSYGIEARDEWGADMSTRLGVTVYQFDCYTKELPVCPEGKVCNFQFNDECVGERMDHNESDTEHVFGSFRDQLASRGHDENGSGDLVMKIDIEGSEWALFADEGNRPLLNRVSQIIAEFHWGSEPTVHMYAAMKNLMQDFVVVHVHQNNCCDMYELDGFRMAHIIEVTLVRRDLVEVGPCDPDPPQAGATNVPENPDLPPAHLPGGTGPFGFDLA